ALAEFAAFAVEDDARELVTSLAAVELHENAPTIAFVIDEAQQVECLHQAAQFLKCAGEPARRSRSVRYSLELCCDCNPLGTALPRVRGGQMLMLRPRCRICVSR